jgi:hypothetical protein
MVMRRLKLYSSWASLTAAIVSLTIVGYLKAVWRFDDDVLPAMMVLVAFLLAVVAFITGFVGMPRWQSFATMFLLAILTYFLFFTELFWMPG